MNPLTPDPEDIHLKDIARALSMMCRYNGHVDRFYSVAEHSVLVSRVAEQRLIARGTVNATLIRDLARWGLLHDASEAYISDVSRPVKHAAEMAPYREIEKRLTEVIAKRFGLELPEPGLIKDIDTEIIGVEATQLKLPIHPDWDLPPLMPELAHQRLGWDPKFAELMFLARYEELFP